MTNETKLVTLPKEVAEAIEHYLVISAGDKERLLKAHTIDGEWGSAYTALDKIDFMTLASALVNGYQIEAKPEDKVREYYDEMYVIASNVDPGRRQYEAECKTDAIVQTLDLLGIKIEGVNA